MSVETDLVDRLEEQASLSWFPCGEGRLPVRAWLKEGQEGGQSRPREKVLLLHGGSGSWLHWVRNIDALSAEFDCYAMDLPGLGDAAMCPIASDAESAAETVADICAGLFDEPFHIVAFSWGCTITAMTMKSLAENLKSVMLTGPASVGDTPENPSRKPLIKRTPAMSEEEVLAVQRTNLSRLMIHDQRRIDELAVWIQQSNTTRARFKSPQYVRQRLVLDGLEGTTTPLFVLYGEFDAPASPDVSLRRAVFGAVRPDARFEIVENAGHWLQYELPEEFNERALSWLKLNC